MAKAGAYTTGNAMDWSATIWAGIIAGAVFLVAEMGLVALMGESPWGPPRMMAAMVLGEGVLPPPATFDMTIVMVAMVVHFIVSIILAAIFVALARKWSMLTALVAGAVFGLIVYGVNFYGMTAVFPWFAMARNPVTIASHVIYGLVLAGSYKALAKA